MLETRDDDLVACFDVDAPPRRRDEIERLRGSAREDQTPRVLYAEELRDTLACLMVSLGRARGEIVRPAMRIRIVLLVVLAHRVEHRARLLRRRRGIEVVKTRMPIQQRKISLHRDADHFRPPT